jgi:hypothetical protein
MNKDESPYHPLWEMRQFHTTADDCDGYTAPEDPDGASLEEWPFEAALHEVQWARRSTLGRSLSD